jgi:hypothetical protein
LELVVHHTHLLGCIFHDLCKIRDIRDVVENETLFETKIHLFSVP